MARVAAAEAKKRLAQRRMAKIRVAIQPYLKELRKRWVEIAEQGHSDGGCILCEEAGVGRCYACKVFGEPVFGEGNGVQCVDFMPTIPSCLFIYPRVVTLLKPERKNKSGQSNLDRAREYGRQMVALLDGLRDDPEKPISTRGVR